MESYKLSWSYGADFQFVLDEGGSEKEFVGNRDTDSVVWHCLDGLQARLVKLHPLTFTERVSLRWELYEDEQQDGEALTCFPPLRKC